jgi:hypothetical protein
MDADEIDPVVTEALTPYQVEWLRRAAQRSGHAETTDTAPSAF